MILPAIAQALRDPRLWRGDFRVYGYALDRLDLVEFRPLKARTIAQALNVRRSHVVRALTRLIDFGYIEAGKLDGHTRTYRLRMSVPCEGQSHAA